MAHSHFVVAGLPLLLREYSMRRKHSAGARASVRRGAGAGAQDLCLESHAYNEAPGQEQHTATAQGRALP